MSRAARKLGRPMMAFVDELNVDGELMHVLLCGHIKPADNDPTSGDPVEFQACEQCADAHHVVTPRSPRISHRFIVTNKVRRKGRT